MSYISQAEMLKRFGEPMLIGLTDRAEVATGLLETETLDRALADTDAVIDGYLAARYALPLSEVQPLLTDVAAAIAIWKLHVYAPDQKITDAYKDAIRSLRDIAQGIIVLTAAGIVPQAKGGTGARSTDRVRPLTPETLRGFI